MKSYFVFLCVISSCGLVRATTTTSVSQDKPDRLYVENYTDNETSEEIEQFDNYDSNGNPAPDEYGYIWWNNDPQDANTVNWNDGSTGSASWTEHDIFTSNVTNTTSDSWSSTYWPTGSWPNIPDGTVTNSNGDTDHAGSPVILEHCDTGVPLVDQTGSYLYPPPGSYREFIVDFATRHAQAKMTLQTGGRSGSKLHNLFGFTATATQIIGVKDPPPFDNNFVQNVPIPQQNIVLGSAGTMPATGTLYKVLPDDTTVDVTPIVAGMDYYTFIVNESKYHSYFEVFVNQPYPGTTYTLSDTTGHAFWQFKTDAPADAQQLYIASYEANYLGQSWGFYPHGANCGLPGQLGNDDSHPKDVTRIFYIGFPDLLEGLIFTRGMSNAPPEYCFAVYGYSCVGATTDAGGSAGITLPTWWNPWNWIPQNFGAAVLLKYPGPLDDETPRYSN